MLWFGVLVGGCPSPSRSSRVGWWGGAERSLLVGVEWCVWLSGWGLLGVLGFVGGGRCGVAGRGGVASWRTSFWGLCVLVTFLFLYCRFFFSLIFFFLPSFNLSFFSLSFSCFFYFFLFFCSFFFFFFLLSLFFFSSFFSYFFFLLFWELFFYFWLLLFLFFFFVLTFCGVGVRGLGGVWGLIWVFLCGVVFFFVLVVVLFFFCVGGGP